jgi:SRSO17 transposase
MTPEELVWLRPRLAEFVAEMLGCLARADQRDKGAWYLRGLLLDGRRKSMQPMADRLGIDHQRLQQFMTSSTWDVAPVRGRLAVWAAELIGPRAFVVDDTGMPKDGPASACVAHQYCGQVGKTTNCQVGVSVHLATNHASAATDWRLFCPASWDDKLAEAAGEPGEAEEIRAKRAKAGVGDEVRHREKWRLALDMLEELIGSDEAQWGLPKLPVAADCGYGDNAQFRVGLEDLGLDYVVAIKPEASVQPGDAEPIQRAYCGRGRPPKPAYPHEPVSVKDLALTAGSDALQAVTWRQGTKKTKGNPTAEMTSNFLLLRVRPANRNIPRAPDGSLPQRLLLVEWPDNADEPTDYWLSNLDPDGTDTPIEQIVDLAKIRWRIEHDYRELKTGLGLGHFEGRSYTGWNRHVTLVSLAQAFLTMLRLHPKAPAPA